MTRKLLTALAMAITMSVQGQRQQVVLETTEGNIGIALFDDTPRHRDNFLRLVDEHFYDSLLFHRVIKGFMIQAGDPTSRHAEPGQTLGEGDVGYTLEPELFAPDGQLLHHHLRGVVAMAREGDDVNPRRLSSGCQFYIVWGKTFSTKDMQNMQLRLDTMTNNRVKLSEETVRAYRKVGGTPHLDGQYTVFGEVVEGLEVIERIQRAFTDDYDRPVDDVRILKARKEQLAP